MRKMANKKKSKSDSGDKSVSNNEQENGDAQSETESDANKKGKILKKAALENENTEDSVSDKKRRRSAKANETDDGMDEEYEVDRIVDARVQKGKPQFKIRWKGYGEKSDTWEFQDNLSCPELIEAFLKDNPDKVVNRPQKRGRPAKDKDSKKKKTADESADDEDEDDDDKHESGESVYEVQKIMDVRFKKNGKKEFLIHWKGFQHKYDSWEPEEHLSCPELIKDILKKAEKAKDIPARELRADPKQTKRLNLAMQQQGRRLSRRNKGKERASYTTSYAS